MKLSRNRFALLACALAPALLLGCGNEGASGTETAAAGDRCAHELKIETCPFCTPSLIESEGYCGEHAVAEALCATCRPYLKAAFRAKGDWCDEHKLPESQCIACNPELADKIRPGVHGGAHPDEHDHDHGDDQTADADACQHGIAEARCPFCTPSLIESEGFCGGHDVAEALCVKCRPYLKTAFIAAGDWCAKHDTPESQCATCNPAS